MQIGQWLQQLKGIGSAGVMLAAVVGTMGSAAELQASGGQIESPTHRQIRVIRPMVDGKSLTLHTMMTDADGHLLVALGGNSPYTMPTNQPQEKPDCYVLRLDSEGQELARWKVDMTPSALTIAPDGTVFVGGSGKVAKLGADGSVAHSVDSPHIGDRKTFAKRTIAAQRRLMQAFLSEDSLKPIKDMIAQIEEVPEDERSRVQKAQLDAFKMQLEQMESLIASNKEEEADGESEDEDDEELDPMMEMQIQHALGVTSMAASDSHVFICATDPNRGGFSVWKMSHDLEVSDEEPVMTDLRGCCGQMDIQCCEDHIVVSENGSFQVGLYDFDGNSVSSFGRQDRTSQNGFGSCCNPMNSLPLADGTILTAESSIGHIKRFDTDGNLVAYIGKARIGGGCKHCSMGYDAKNDLYFMQSQDKNQICVLGSNERYPITEAELLVAKRKDDFLTAYAGTWSKGGKVTEKKSNSIFGSFFTTNETTDADAMYPFTSWTIEPEGDVKLNSGQYAAFMQSPALELLPAENDDSPNTYRIAIAEDQVQMVEAKLTINGESMEVEFSPGMTVSLEKVADAAGASPTCTEPCDGKKCESEACKTETVGEIVLDESKSTASTATITVEAAAYPVAKVATATAAPKVVATTVVSPSARYRVATPNVFSATYEYKMVAMKDLGEDKETELNKLGADGWEFCSRIGKELMFKRVSGTRVEVKQ